jgi:hypothetical protein
MASQNQELRMVPRGSIIYDKGYILSMRRAKGPVAGLIKNPPITKLGKAGREQVKETRKVINARNKARSKDMERKVARLFGEGGHRVPMSGAMPGWKGDVIVEFRNNPGKMLIECKLSEAKDEYGSPSLTIVFEWLNKIQHETEQTRSKLGILVIHYLYVNRILSLYVINTNQT